MMIQKYAKILDYNPNETNNHLKNQPIEISDETNDPDNVNNVIVYFDAALSRKIVSDKSVYAKYVSITENKETVYFVYNKKNFINETNYEKFKDLIDSKKDIKESNLDIYTGNCLCTYISKIQSIRVYPKDEISIEEKEFKII